MFTNIHLACRSLRQRPTFSVVVVMMLALGVGATTALFSLFHQILVQPLPVPQPERLVNISSPGPRWGSTSTAFAGGSDYVFSYPMFRDLERQQTAFSGIAAHFIFETNLAYGEQMISGMGMLVSGQYFSVLNLQPALGRLITPQDEPKLDESAVVVLSHEYWRTKFGSDPSIINRTMTVNGQALTIIGVAPAGFSGAIIGVKPQVFVPLTLAWRLVPGAPRNYDDRRAYWLYLFARLKPNVSVERTSAEINGLFSGILKKFDAPLNSVMPDDVMARFLQQRMALNPGARGFTTIPEITSQALMLLLGLTALVLLIACVNITNLLLARGAARASEMAIRASLGASRIQLVSQLLTESVVLAILGGILSIPVAITTLGIIDGMLPAETSRQLAIQLSPPAVFFAAGVSLLTVLVFGLFPAVQASRIDGALTMKQQAPQLSGARGMTRFRTTLVTAQITLSMVLLVLAGLFTRSLENVSRVNLGMQLDSIVSFSVSPRANGYSPEKTRLVFDEIEQALAAAPGVTGVASASIPLITGQGSGNSITIEGKEQSTPQKIAVRRNEVGDGFFKTLSIPLVTGRDFTEQDTLSSPKVAIVNQSFVRMFDLGEKAVGTRFSGNPYDNVRKIELEIVGVVADAAYNSVKDDIPAQYFQPRRQTERPDALAFYVRSGIDPDALVRDIPQIVSGVDRNLPVNNVITMRRQVQDNVYLDRLIAMLSVGFAVLATLLAAIGLYGVLAYNVTQRTREFGLRLALGSEPHRLRWMVLRQVTVMALIGGTLGIAAAVTLGRAAEVLLFGLKGYNLGVLSAAAILLSAVVFVASYLPARRASNIAPIEALRYE